MDIAGFWFRQARALRDPFDRLMAAYVTFTYLHIGGRKPKESERGCAVRYAAASGTAGGECGSDSSRGCPSGVMLTDGSP